MASLPEVRRTTLGNRVYDTIRAAIVGHDARPGERLRIDALARDLGVSQTPVREALARLLTEALVTYEPLVGYRVAPILDPVGFDRLMEARFVIEPRLASLAAQRGPLHAIPSLRELAPIDNRDSGADRYGRYRRHTERDAAFHAAVAAAAGNSFLADALARLYVHLHIYRLHHPVDGLDSTEAEHLAIVTAIEASDPAHAAEAMLAHLDASYHRHAAGLAQKSTPQ
ncbi:MAG: GntR family transcriptional regulator [bacterium]|nr:GntR family transcriptional regulator [bacterium]